jgi:hypothetical protein
LASKDNIVPKSYDETTVSNASELIINDEYASLVPPIKEQEYESIRQSIEDNGQWVPIITNPQQIILDGHTRFRACKELGLELRIMIREFADSLQEKQFIIQINRNRRQLTSFQRVELEYKYQTIQSELAKKRMSEAGKTGAEKRWKGGRAIDVSKKSSEDGVIQNNTTPSNSPKLAEKTGRVIDISAKNAQVSPATYNKGRKIIELAPPQEILNKLRIGEISINKAYGQLKTKQNPQQQSETSSNIDGINQLLDLNKTEQMLMTMMKQILLRLIKANRLVTTNQRLKQYQQVIPHPKMLCRNYRHIHRTNKLGKSVQIASCYRIKSSS